jgi:hypothetical protein
MTPIGQRQPRASGSSGGGFGMLMLFVLVCQPVDARAQGQSLNVTNFGARGDAQQMLVGTVSNSAVVTVQTTNRLSRPDVGKVILLFGVGPATTPTNNQDLVAQIVSVANGTNVTISEPAQATSRNVPATYGTHNAVAFQECVAACTNTNAVVLVPPGTYLMVSPAMLDTNLNTAPVNGQWPSAVIIQRGGIHFLGASPTNTVLLNCGAWILDGGEVYRGWMFTCRGPVTNNVPLIFDQLTFDGGVQTGRTAYFNSGPARTTDGAGWDVSHDAVVVAGAAPVHQFLEFTGCTFTHWRGEMLKAVADAGATNGFVLVTNCMFLDGEASGYNIGLTHTITHCVFSNLAMAEEFYVGYTPAGSIFEDSVATNLAGGIVLSGAFTNYATPPYTIRGNSFAPTGKGILMGPSQNVTIISNRFYGSMIGIGTDGYAYQGTSGNSNILITGNSFSGVQYVFNVAGGGQDSMVNVIMSSNSVSNCYTFANGYGWSSNIVFLGNTMTGTSSGSIHSSDLVGQWFIDDLSNLFPYFTNTDAGVSGTNVITYANGIRELANSGGLTPVYYLDDAHATQMPPGAFLLVSNSSPHSVKLILSTTSRSATSTNIPPAFVARCDWQSPRWQLTWVHSPVAPPSGLHVIPPQ